MHSRYDSVMLRLAPISIRATIHVGDDEHGVIESNGVSATVTVPCKKIGAIYV